MECSLFDHGKLRYGTRSIILREHFRSMPEIIRFSNDLCYSDTPLIPLRQYGPDRLIPLMHFYVDSGYREGSNNLVRNRPEAEMIVEKIVELCNDPRYTNKTIGVVVLQGNAQANLIEEKLLGKLGADEMEKRRLICGNAYSFQGDERDIMFLSMVAATNERIGPLTKSSDERRFNVAASRARDQMFLFHSVKREDLSQYCLRRKLLEFFENTVTQEIAGININDLEKKAKYENRAIVKSPKPFDSWFEVDVALEILHKGFKVIPQYEVAGKRIDLVVEGGNARIAVECDGDKWHGADKYEEDMIRQRQLERCNWEFFRVRGASFYLNRENALQSLWRLLDERNIKPFGNKNSSSFDKDDKFTKTDVKFNGEEVMTNDSDNYLNDDSEAKCVSDNRKIDEVSTSEISKSVLEVLKDCPNNSCKLDSLTGRVLKDLCILTRGNPRIKFENRVMRMVNILEKKNLIEKYKSKNKRLRLLKH